MSTMPSTEKPRIVLFNPSPKDVGKYFGLPLPLLAISALPHAAGYPVTIVVQDVADDYETEVLEACEGALLLGVTSLTGAMIGFGLDMCAKVRERYPDLPIVWGGTHPSIAPEQTCEHPLVDIVVAGQGEATFMDLIDAIETGRPLDEVEGILFKRDGEIVRTPEREKIDIDALPPTPYELLDMERFILLHSQALHTRLAGRRGVTYYSSYGCPFSCSFCSEPMTSQRRWMSKSPETVVNELQRLKTDFGVDVIIFEDPIFFVDVRRAKKIAELMIERDLNMAWAATSRLETIKKIDEPTWDILTRSGFLQVFIGVESASPTVLKAIGKRYTADDIVEASRILFEHDVTLSCGFIQGIPATAPGRTFEEIQREDMRLSAQTILRMYKAHPKATIYVFMYTPYPGSAAYNLSLEHGFVPPDSLAGWSSFKHYSNQVPWMLHEQQVFAQSAVMAMKALKTQGRELTRLRRKKIKGAILMAYSAITRARYKHGYFKFPIDQHLFGKLARHVNQSRNPDGQNSGMLI
jgi:anaerobic magnesium-protoporphyrin IX monomethyl ester cyclase